MKSSAVLSSWICTDCVSVTSSSRLLVAATTRFVMFSTAKLSSLTFESSCLVYLSSTALSSSFWRLATAHCSSSYDSKSNSKSRVRGDGIVYAGQVPTWVLEVWQGVRVGVGIDLGIDDRSGYR